LLRGEGALRRDEVRRLLLRLADRDRHGGAAHRPARGAGTGLGLATNVNPNDAAAAPIQTIGLVGGLVLLVIILISYFAGGYVAGRMARFAGAKQGIGVWLWALIIAVVVAILGAVAGSQFNLLANLNGFPRIPVNEGDLTTAGIITAIAVALLALIGAILGGLAGMAYHRRVDREGLGR
jgi:amino acid transporter